MDKKLLILSIGIVVVTSLHQPLIGQVRDAGMWLFVSGSVPLNPRASLNVTEEVRLHENMLEVGTFLTDVGVDYQLTNSWRASASYRFISRQQLDRTYLHRHRYYLDLRYRHRIGRTDWMLRARWLQQFRHEDFVSANMMDMSSYLRAKGSFRWRMKRTWRPYMHTEFFFPVTMAGVHIPDKVRVIAGTRYRINRAHEIDLYYLIQKGLNVKSPRTDFVVGLGYQFSPGFNR